MPDTAEDYASWIVANKDKKGTPEFETVATAYQQALDAEGAAVALRLSLHRPRTLAFLEV
jgi:hypothetical protein